MYRALYRKWRPRRFEDVVGQQAIVAALQNQVAAGRVGHAYLFTGTRGTGKTSCAKIFAKAINCPESQNGDPCGKCAVCAGIDDGSIMDVVEIDAASNNGVDNIRDLRDETAYTPSVCAYKVYIIDEVHMLSMAAFNALLKIMEEPPSHVVFILATTEIHKVPATILSRCQRYDFGRIQPQDIAARIAYIAGEEGFALTPGAAALIARLADGALRDALSILDTCAGVSREIDEELVRRMAGVTDKSYLFTISDALAARDAADALSQVAGLRQRSVDMKRLCEELISHYRNLMLAALPGGKGLLAGVPPEEEALYLEKAGQTPQSESVRAIRLLGSALEKMSRGTDQRIELELALFALTETPQSAAPAPVAPAAPAAQPPAPFAARPAAAGAWAPAAAGPAAPPQRTEAADRPPWEAAAEEPPSAAPPPEGAAAPPASAPIQPGEGQDAPPWETEPVQPREVPPPKAPAPPAPPAPAKAQAAPAGQAQKFEPWPQVLAALERQDKMLTAYLKKSTAYFDGRRVLIDGGDTFRDFIRVNKDSQALIKQIIEQVAGVRCGIGPYVPPAEGGEARSTVEDTLKELAAHGVDVVYNDKE